MRPRWRSDAHVAQRVGAALRTACTRNGRLRVLPRHAACPRVAASRARGASRVDPDARRRAPGGAALAAGERRGDARAGDPRVHPVPQERRTAPRDEPRHPYFAGHGYAACGSTCAAAATPRACSPTSTSPQEQDDADDVLAWLAAQPWCNGRVGMIGISWGGFNALQIAARRPAAAAARRHASARPTTATPTTSTTWAAACSARHAVVGVDDARLQRPPAGPERRRRRAGARCGCERLRGSAAVASRTGSRHQRRDAYWQHGSVCEDFARITCPVYAVGGWADGYTQRDPALARRARRAAQGPDRAVVAQLSRTSARPGPAIGFLQETLRWFDHWLQGHARTASWTGRCCASGCRSPCRPRARHDERPGRWVAEPAWPSPRDPLARARDRRSRPRSRRRRRCRVCAAPRCDAHGADAGTWCPYGEPADLPPDQRDEDARCSASTPSRWPSGWRCSASRRSRPRADGRPAGRRSSPCACATSRPTARRCLVARGVLNLTHRDSHERPARPCRRASASSRGSSSTCWDRRSPRAIGCGLRSPRRTGRGPGPRPRRSR